MILVTGGSGRLGTRLIRGLVTAAEPVRVLTRDPRRCAHLTELPVEIAVGDVRTPGTLAAALAGVTVVVSAMHGFIGPGRVSPRTVDQEGNAHLIDAAVAARADVILMSVVGAAPAAPMSLFRAKYAAEQHLRASGTPWTIVRATPFTETWATILKAPVVPGRGDNPIAFVSVADVAALVQVAVLDAGIRGRVLEIGGPDDVTLSELAAAVQGSIGGGKTVRHVPRALLRALAPVSRRAQAAVVMDTTNMTFDRTSNPDRSVGGTPVLEAMRRLAVATGDVSHE